MNIEIKIPSMGESVIEVTIGRILKKDGSFVQKDEELLEIETDKVNQVLSAPTTGVFHLKIETGKSAKVGEVIGYIEEKEGVANKPLPPPTPAPAPKNESVISSPTSSIRIGVDEAIKERMLPEKIAKTPQPSPPEPVKEKQVGGRREKMSKLRKVIGERLVKVKNETAMLTTFNEVDMSAIIAVREKEQETFLKKHGVKLGFMSFFVKAVVHALEEFPQVGARIDGDEIVFSEKNHIGVAVSTDKGLMVPVLRSPIDQSFAAIETSLKKYAEEARKGVISIDAMQGATFTITNGGVFGSLLSTPILNPPQSAILGMHSIVKRVVVVEDQMVIRPMMYLALSYDHRIVDGKESIQFLVHIKNNLEEPTRLLLDL